MNDCSVETPFTPACGHPATGTADPTEGATTPNFPWISPNLCMDGHDAPCADGDPGDTACCGETSGVSASHPNAAEPGMGGPGGGDVGAVLLSPFIKPGTVSAVDYNHYSTLRTIEDIFGLSHLGDAAMPQVRPFGRDVFGN